MTQTQNKDKSNRYASTKVVELQQYFVPKVVEVRGKKWVYWGENNDYPQYLIDLYNQSAVHNALINGKVSYLKGKGIVLKTEGTSQAERAQAVDFISRANEYEDWFSLLGKMFFDNELFNGYAIEVIRRRDGGFNFYHIDFSRLRFSEDERTIYYSDNWLDKYGKRNYRPTVKEYKLFDPYNEDQKRGLIIHREHRPEMNHYPLPVYQGAIAAIETTVEIANYHLNNIKNGFSAGTMISFNNGVPETEEEQEYIENELERKFTGSENANRFVMVFSPSKDSAPTIERLMANDLNEQFDIVEKNVQQNIFTGHQVVSPMLFGVRVATQLGGRDEIAVAYETFKKTYIHNRQSPILRTLNKIARVFSGVNAQFVIDELKPVDIGVPFSENVIMEHLDRNEIRKLLNDRYDMNLELDTQEQVAMSDVKINFSDLETAMADYLDGKGVYVPNESRLFTDSVYLRSEEGYTEPNEIFKFQEELSDLALLMLGLIAASPDISYTDLSRATDTPLENVYELGGLMMALGYIERDGAKTRVTRKGGNAAKLMGAPSNVKIMFEYNLREDAAPLKAGSRSRKFCERMMAHTAEGRLFSKEEIENMKNDMKKDFAPEITDVFMSRGGWYRPPGSQFAVPFCRHEWKQVVVLVDANGNPTYRADQE
jgi:hypothetical protein